MFIYCRGAVLTLYVGKGFPATFGFVVAALVVVAITQLLVLHDRRQKIREDQEGIAPEGNVTEYAKGGSPYGRDKKHFADVVKNPMARVPPVADGYWFEHPGYPGQCLNSRRIKVQGASGQSLREKRMADHMARTSQLIPSLLARTLTPYKSAASNIKHLREPRHGYSAPKVLQLQVPRGHIAHSSHHKRELICNIATSLSNKARKRSDVPGLIHAHNPGDYAQTECDRCTDA